MNLEAMFKNALVKVQNLWNLKFGSTLNYIALIDQSYNDKRFAHASGFIMAQSGHLLCTFQIDTKRFSNFSNSLQQFVVAHEVSHCMMIKIPAQEESNFDSIINAVSGKLNSVIILQPPPTSPVNWDIYRFIIDSTSRFRNAIQHKCFDYYAKEILTISQPDYESILSELSVKSSKNKVRSKNYIKKRNWYLNQISGDYNHGK